MNRPAHVVIVGGGFAGLHAARELRRADVRITLVDRRNHHLFQPLLYQVATAALNPSDIAAPIRSLFRNQRNVTTLLDQARAIDPARKVLVLSDRELSYDFLIVATGVTHSYFGHDEWAEAAPGLKTLEDALTIRRRILLAYEAAEREEDPQVRREWLTFVIIGGGPTGVELAGALAEISRHTLRRDFRNIDPASARILLLEGLPVILQTYPPDLSEKAVRQLTKLGVEVRTSTRVTHIESGAVHVGDERIAARTILWAAGVQGSPLVRSLGAPLDRAGRVIVEQDLTIPGHPEVFVTGDVAAVSSEGGTVPGVAQGAIQQGKHAAKNIRLHLRSKPHEPFHYVDKGSLATIGRAAAVADLHRIHLSGFPAWMAWLLIHVLFLIGFRNRVRVLLEWAWAYVTWERGARLITGDEGSRPPTRPGP